MSSSLPGLKGSFSLSLTINSRLAPGASLVIYAIFPSGGVIADKIKFSVEMCFDNKVKWQLRRVKKKNRGIPRDLVYARVEIRQGLGNKKITLKLDIVLYLYL